MDEVLWGIGMLVIGTFFVIGRKGYSQIMRSMDTKRFRPSYYEWSIALLGVAVGLAGIITMIRSV